VTRRLRVVVLAAGLLLFAWLIARVGPAALVAQARQAGWMIFPILLVYALTYFCFASTWWIVLSDVPGRPSLGKLYAITVSGFALNYLTPFISLGGEPYKTAAASGTIGGRRAASSVVTYNVIHSVSNVSTWLGGLVVAGTFMPRTQLSAVALCAVGLALLALAAIVLAARRSGLLTALLGIWTRLPLGRRLAAAAERRREAITEIDAQIATFFRRHPGRFALAVGIDTLGRLIGMLEFWLIFLAVGEPAPIWKIYLIGSLSTLILNLLFFVPFELGSREGGMYVLFQLLGFSPALAVFTAIVNRVREVIWIGVGLALIGLRDRATDGPGRGERA